MPLVIPEGANEEGITSVAMIIKTDEQIAQCQTQIGLAANKEGTDRHVYVFVQGKVTGRELANCYTAYKEKAVPTSKMVLFEDPEVRMYTGGISIAKGGTYPPNLQYYFARLRKGGEVCTYDFEVLKYCLEQTIKELNKGRTPKHRVDIRVPRHLQLSDSSCAEGERRRLREQIREEYK